MRVRRPTGVDCSDSESLWLELTLPLTLPFPLLFFPFILLLLLLLLLSLRLELFVDADVEFEMEDEAEFTLDIGFSPFDVFFSVPLSSSLLRWVKKVWGITSVEIWLCSIDENKLIILIN